MAVFAGSWGFRPGPKGLQIFSFDPQTAEMTFVRTLHSEFAVGNQYLDAKRSILYITDESGLRRGDAVGGYVQAFRLDPKSVLTELNGRETLLPKPSYFCLDHTGAYALVSHHSNRGQVTKLVRRADGTFSSETVTDDAGLALLSVREDGSLGEILDVVLTPGEDPFGPHARSHQHCVAASPDGELFLVCDKGLDRIYSFRLDREKGRLRLLHTTYTELGSAPRYALFHPYAPVVYVNHEHQPVLYTYGYDIETGELNCMDALPLCEAVETSMQPSVPVLHPNGRILYMSVRGTDLIGMFRIDGGGLPHLEQTVSCGGQSPRGLCLSPDGRFLLCANLESQTITRFAVEGDGTLTAVGEPVPTVLPGNLTIASLE